MDITTEEQLAIEKNIPNVSLITHSSGKGNAQRVSYEELLERPDPQPMGRFHRPLRYSDLIERTEEGLGAIGYKPLARDFVLARKGGLLMGMYHINGHNGVTLPDGLANKTLLAFLASETQITGLKMRVGTKIFICDNLSISGQCSIVTHKFTTQAQMLARITHGLFKWTENKARYERRCNELRNNYLTDNQAAGQILEIAAGNPELGTRGVVPFKYAQKAYDEYFKPNRDLDTNSRTEWGLYNSWTRALREAPVQSQHSATIALSSYYKL